MAGDCRSESVGWDERSGEGFNQPLDDNRLTIGSGSRFPAVAPNREIPKKNEGQRLSLPPVVWVLSPWAQGVAGSNPVAPTTFRVHSHI